MVCDVYESDLADERLGDTGEIRLNAYRGRVFRGKVSNIGAILDPNIRTAKVRIEVRNPGMMRIGIFVSRHVPGSNLGNAYRRAGIRDRPYSRPRFRLRARTGGQVPAGRSRERRWITL